MTIPPAIRRNLYWSIAAMVCVLVVGGIFFHDSEVGNHVVPGVAFFGSLLLLMVLNDRELRREEQSGGTPAP